MALCKESTAILVLLLNSRDVELSKGYGESKEPCYAATDDTSIVAVSRLFFEA